MPERGKRGTGKSARLPQPGDAFLMPLADGRLGFCHVVDVPTRVMGIAARGQVFVEVSSWVGTEAPDLDDPRLREVLVQSHHGTGPNIWRVVTHGPAPSSFRKLGSIEPDRSAKVIAVFTSWENLAAEVLTQWRWEHDRASLLAEEKEGKERWSLEQARIAERQRERRDALTLESLQKKRRFSSWKGDRPDAAIAACRAAFRDAVGGLIGLGRKPEEQAVGMVIQRLVERLNELDEQYDGFIETGEREDICREVDELVYVAGLRGCDGMADRWRDW